MHLTYSYRIKDKTSKKILNELASKVNFVWNYCNEVSYKSIKSYSKWLSKFDLQSLTANTSKDLNLLAKTVQLICHEYATKRYQHKKLKLKWRTKKSLGYIPIDYQCLKIKDGEVIFMKRSFRFWKSREMKGTFKFGSFSQDSRGRWYINLTFEQETPKKREIQSSVGIDLGLKTLVTCSNGQKFDRDNLTKQYEKKLAKAQRANKKRQVSNIHTKIKNKRKDWTHKLSDKLTKNFDFIVIGNLKGLGQRTKLAKSIYDANWFDFKNMLGYKSIRNGSTFFEVCEAYSTQTCSSCGVRSGPKNDLSVREWTCSVCRSVNDRDINAAKNILRFGYETLTEAVD